MDLLGNDVSLDDVKDVPDSPEFALDSILSEFGQDETPPPERRIEDEYDYPSRPIETEPEGFGIEAAVLRSDAFSHEDEPDEDIELKADIAALLAEAPPGTEPTSKVSPLAPEPDSVPASEGDDDVKIYNIGDIIAEVSALFEEDVKPYRTASAVAEGPAAVSPVSGDTGDFAFDEQAVTEAAERAVFDTGEIPEFAYAPAAGDDTAQVRNEAGKTLPEGAPAPVHTPQKGGLSQALSAPFLSLLALFAIRKQRYKESAFDHTDGDEDLGPEMDADGASRYYAAYITSLRTRFRLSVLLSIILAWVSFGLPVAGALRTSTSAAALVCLILELSVVMLGLDIFTSGMTALLSGRPSMWSFVSLSCITAALDAVATAVMGNSIIGLPFCAVAGLSMCFALAGSLQTCKGFRLSLRALALSRSPYVVTAEAGIADDGNTLLKSRIGTEGYLRRCEEPDCAETVYGTAAPFLLMLILILTVLATAISGEWKYFFRTLAAVSAPCAPFAAFLAFPLPYYIISRRIFQSGAAIAGWAGLRDIGQSKHLIVNDSDIFPTGTVSIESIRILEGMSPQKVISCTSSVICASGSGLAPVFSDLMRKNGCTMQRVEDFCCHEGGGLTAMIDGEEVLCGNSGFMKLMSIRLPQKLASKSSIFVSINGLLAGVFTIKYTAVTSVQDALASLLQTRREPIFAVRDFNITPLMIKQKFRMPTDGLDFPSFQKRYEVSAAAPAAESRVSAIISREGLGPLVEVSENGRRLYITSLLSTILAALCTVVGLVLMFTLCLSGSFDSATVGNVLTYMLLWLAPIIVLSVGMSR